MNVFEIRNLLKSGKSLYDLPLNVTFYARVSTDRDEQLNSLGNQVMYFKKFINEQTNWTYIPGYIDEGISGKSVKKRENFLRMIDDAKMGKFNLILTKEISRFSRNTVDSIKYTQALLSYNVGIYFLNDNINTFDSDSELRLTIMSSIAQDELRKLSERVRFGYKRSIEKGVVPGSNNIYGYTKNKGKLIIDEEEAKLIRLIFTEYSKGKMGTSRLGHYLYNEYGIKSKTGKPLAGTVIGRIIRNPKYKGYYCAHKETTIDYLNQKRIKFNKDDWTIYKDNEACPPIVSEELWEKCNKIIERNSKNYEQKTPTNMKYALSGKIKCMHDGATFTKGFYKNKKTGEKTNFLACSNYRKYGKVKGKGCETPILKYNEIVDIFRKVLKQIIINEDDIINDIFEYINQCKINKNNKKELREILLKIDNINKAKMELIDMKARCEINLNEYKMSKIKYEKELFKLNEKKKKLSDNTLEKYKENIDEFKRKINSLVFEDDEAVLRVGASIVDKIYVEKLPDIDKNTKKIILHFRLNVLGHQKDDLNFDDFLLLFGNTAGRSSSAC